MFSMAACKFKYIVCTNNLLRISYDVYTSRAATNRAPPITERPMIRNQIVDDNAGGDSDVKHDSGKSENNFISVYVAC